jgi:O-methyltransferase involved in polyketide biosynthesis
MTEKIKLHLGEVQRTLLIPLWGRAQEYENTHSFLKDKFAREIVAKLDFDFGSFDSIAKRASKQLRLSNALRAYHIDTILKKIIEKYPDLTVVNIGAGLDTTFQRVDNGKIFWYDLDLPDTIALRKQLIPESERNKYISKSFLDITWYQDIQKRSKKVVFVVAGVFPYFKPEQVRDFILSLQHEFPSSEIIFETMGKIIIWLFKLLHRSRKAGENSVVNSIFQGGISSAKIVKKWSDKIEIVDNFSVFTKLNINESFEPTFQIRLMKFFKLYQIVHLKLG